jgi:L-iditol 2-dehydrogenase
MTEKVKAAILYKPGEIRIEEVDKPRIRADEILIRVKAVGVCGSDVHYYKRGRIGPYMVESPLILGHECSGIVEEIGSEVRHLAVGERVAIEPGVPCRRCQFCKAGRYNLCRDVVFMATPPVNGAFTEYVATAADFVYRLPVDMTCAEGALIEPLAVGMHAARRGGVSAGSRVAALGSGTIGLMTIAAAEAHGATEIYAVDLAPNRLALAAKIGATETINAADADAVEAILELTHGEGVDIVFETAGAVETVKQTFDVVKRGGTVVWVGLPAQETVPLKVAHIIDEELTIQTVFRYANVYPDAIRLVASGRLDLKPLITHEFPLEQTGEALRFADEQKEMAVKVMVVL